MSVDIAAQRASDQCEVGIPQVATRARGAFTVTADGQYFIVNGREAISVESSVMTVVVNWAAAPGARK